MELLPAIDLRDGRCVRLLKGDFGRETRYPVAPCELAARNAALGARWLHVVDLDGAECGSPRHLDLVKALRRHAGLKVQLGGGIRSAADLTAALAVAERVVIGSLAVTEPERVERWLGEVGPDRLTLALDVRLDDGDVPLVATHGWTQASGLTLWDALERYARAGLRNVLCTDVDRDGALNGPNLALYRHCVTRCPQIAFQASGGVRDAHDLRALADTGVALAISGKALLEGRLTDEEVRSFLPNA
ncbi:MAG: 1-(5-phosphoribosyl)-5-[(5-phosphoribosylamino)methylideneamino] imidazole-4-carboxamide isomerase [Rhodospirillaceae bacterium]|nr:1-(5-phosphoribosyl)-5-[(5-phosphoribosylamino)methylideneamino] imidazole-4-carboxamide isomerase [Rhodospirillaceae bacterium]